MAEKLTGVILAAGRGSRMALFSDEYPKPLLPICNKPIMQYQIEMMRDLGITDVFIVVGHLKNRIMDSFQSGAELGVKIHYVEQSQPLGIAHAVGQLERFVETPFLMFLGDIFYAPKDMRLLLESRQREENASVLVVQRNQATEVIKQNFAIMMGEDGRVRRVIEKPRHITNHDTGFGIYLFDPVVFDAVRRTPRTAMRDEYEITEAIQILIDDGYPVFAEEAIDWILNVTYPKDLLNCTVSWMKTQGVTSVVADSAEVHPDCRLDYASIGENVIVRRPIRIANSIVLPNTVVESDGDMVDCVRSARITIDCG
ncbi:MAG: sugar phosphate nucleotidyltransferase [Armatimonadota bacterium]|nr:sugar phosphate nucleotidyltransferase [Armatimonadota bacterium]